MIKDIYQFPLLNTHQFILNTKEIIRLCDEGIQESESNLEQLRLELDNAVLEYEQDEIIENIVACNLHLGVCALSRSHAYSGLKQFDFILN